MERPEKYIDLFNLVQAKGTLSEDESRVYFRQMVVATMACHKAKVLHGDLKEENMLVDLKDNTIKLIDFGGGALLRDGEYTEFLGTPVYAPPEWHKYGNYHAVPATVWTLGITLFSIASEDIPFQNKEEICSGELRFPDGLSTSFRDLVGSMLSVDPEKRPRLEEILRHEWLKESDGD
ncbi:serine/threonine-protein kinase pim-3-like [Amphiura filiformis]|uniref:serine/threonine-protein kinase pim-3-like n=1 Tax=Amphiura filiformis TaxID=82378 RepID=UPI003B21CDE8